MKCNKDCSLTDCCKKTGTSPLSQTRCLFVALRCPAPAPGDDGAGLWGGGCESNNRQAQPTSNSCWSSSSERSRFRCLGHTPAQASPSALLCCALSAPRYTPSHTHATASSSASPSLPPSSSSSSSSAASAS